MFLLSAYYKPQKYFFQSPTGREKYLFIKISLHQYPRQDNVPLEKSANRMYYK